MNKKQRTRALSVILCIVLLAAAALTATGCHGNQPPPSTSLAEDTPVTVLGEGQTTFSLTVTDKAGITTAFEIHTDRKTVGDALLELGLIAGEAGDYGLYVKTVNGITADYDTDGTYWAFYENGSYAMAGADQTAITAGTVYGFRIE